MLYELLQNPLGCLTDHNSAHAWCSRTYLRINDRILCLKAQTFFFENFENSQNYQTNTFRNKPGGENSENSENPRIENTNDFFQNFGNFQNFPLVGHVQQPRRLGNTQGTGVLGVIAK